MKKILGFLFAFALLFGLSFQASAQYGTSSAPLTKKVDWAGYIYGATTDTVGAVPTKAYYFNLLPAGALVQPFYKIDSISGTPNVKVVFQESFDNSYWIGRDSVTLKLGLYMKKGVAFTTYAPYLRVTTKGTGTQVTKMQYFVTFKF